MQSILSAFGGGDEPQPLTPQQRRDWNMYVDWLEKKGYKGSKDLDRKETGLAVKLFNDFKKEFPKTTIQYGDVSQVQREMQSLKDSVQAFAARRNDPNAGRLMAGVSKVDNWPGSRTTQFKFPNLEVITTHNNDIVSRQNMGLLSGDFKPSASDSLTAMASRKPPPPSGLKLEKWSDGKYYYQDPKNPGEYILYRK